MRPRLLQRLRWQLAEHRRVVTRKRTRVVEAPLKADFQHRATALPETASRTAEAHTLEVLQWADAQGLHEA